MKIFLTIITILLLNTTGYCDSYTSPELESGNVAKANPSACINSKWPTSNYTNRNRGEVILYKVPSSYNPTVTNLACIASIEFLSRINKLPTKAVVGLISEDYSRGILVQWSLADDYMLLIDITIPHGSEYGVGKFVKYPQPLTRIKEIITNKPFPTLKTLPAHLKSKLKSNLTRASKQDLTDLYQ